jgi:hypothetical protein
MDYAKSVEKSVNITPICVIPVMKSENAGIVSLRIFGAGDPEAGAENHSRNERSTFGKRIAF